MFLYGNVVELMQWRLFLAVVPKYLSFFNFTGTNHILFPIVGRIRLSLHLIFLPLEHDSLKNLVVILRRHSPFPNLLEMYNTRLYALIFNEGCSTITRASLLATAKYCIYDSICQLSDFLYGTYLHTFLKLTK